MAEAPDGPALATPDGKVVYSSIMDFKGMKEIYRGRHSVVWRCQCRATKVPLVVKGYVKEKMRVRHFQQVAREVGLMQKCIGAGIVRFTGSFEDAKCIYIAQEDCSGGDLFQMLNDCGGVMRESDVVQRVRLSRALPNYAWPPPHQPSFCSCRSRTLAAKVLSLTRHILFATPGSLRAVLFFFTSICTARPRPSMQLSLTPILNTHTHTHTHTPGERICILVVLELRDQRRKTAKGDRPGS